MHADRVRQLARAHWVDIAWVAFIGLNLLAMRLLSAWQTIPFLVIWVSLTAVYGFRLWRLGSTVVVVAVVTLATGGLIGWQVLRGEQDGDYLAEVPLLAMMFVVMAWHARRRVCSTSRRNCRSAAAVSAGRLPRAGNPHHHRPWPRRAHRARCHRPGNREGCPGGRG